MATNVLKIENYEVNSSVVKNVEIEASIFRQSVLNGINEFKKVNKFHPITAAGSRAWSEIVATFRQLVVTQDANWKSEHMCGMPILVNSQLLTTIIITSGDKNTGMQNATPRTKNEKGQVTKNIVGQNYSLFEEPNEIVSSFTAIDPHQTWVFLYYLDKEAKEVRFELSLPLGTSLSGSSGKIKISDWKTRVIFPSVPFSGDDIDVVDTSFTDDSDFFEVIKKK
ncbi:hypothetical protein C9J20_16350 [Photobacterium phosphoreum]|jgi:hypothetical protein|uniref:hypothetical protein n=1 Tax=Photobacterium phosphoreum TaxID=659 RepID=UPI000D1601DA|nr:hypothetical protein [Photobacterium phosphoreum]MCD9475041.1 hypothetical protein [Photobacterium phosphoreum]MCD9505361.1 hypothetical protein [Photobacterium phosphoreum]MCF2175826.1 hypothetical protein [Photobacterium phosphoreum]PSU68989.1 hypothetical protein CTM79_11915 [Photobacterium phosphoreum]PSW09303.1 hypothetical protein C9J20_16350 [Photobacterium phosphoreum]